MGFMCKQLGQSGNAGGKDLLHVASLFNVQTKQIQLMASANLLSSVTIM